MDTLRFPRPPMHALSICVVLGCFLTLSAGDDQQVVYAGNSRVVEGDPFTITCHVTAFEPIKWQHNKQDIPDYQNQYKIETEKIDGKVVAKLSVSQAQHIHTGSYQCTPIFNQSHQVYVQSANSVQGVYDHKPYKRLEYDKPLVLQCTIDAPSDTQYTLKWFKEDKPLEGERFKINTEENKLTVSKAGEDDIGNYTCQAVNAKTNVTEKAMRAEIQVIGLPKITMAEDTPVVEGERLRLHCSVRGYPTPKVIWLVDDKIANDSRIRYENDKNVLEAFLVIDSAQMSDRHTYTCRASNEANQELPAVEKKTFVRVKDKLAALWPFLGICAEVAVLCTIILIYEKKRNKTELDESDTDQSPEQKNTPDHGKDVRQRK